MLDIEKKISPLIESQFPAFYREEGTYFVAFVEAYYEWLEKSYNPIGQARNLAGYRDIDTTLEQFIVYFKEKYLKNIQFDTATNKQLLVKNSLDLYRSKGTDRAVDLFFKLVYGTQADVKYPGEDLLRLSDGVWQKPTYLEVTDTVRNVDYVGRRIQGTRSNATAFVERYIKRRIRDGYVHILYVSDIVGEFEKNEVIAYIVEDTLRVFEASDPVGQSPRLIGSVREVVIQDGGRDFKEGDIVSFTSSQKGLGGLARVNSTVDTTGVVDFLFFDGGWGYTLSANSTSSLSEQRLRTQSIVSEKVINLEDVVADNASKDYFRILEPLVQRLVEIDYSSATDYLTDGTTLYRYNSNGEVVTAVSVLSSAQDDSGVGNAVVSILSGPVANGFTYYTAGNTTSLQVDTYTDISIAGKVMGIPNTYTMSITGLTGGNIAVGDYVYQKDIEGIYAHGVVESIQASSFGNTVVLTEANGAFKYSNSAYSLNEIKYTFNGNTAVDELNDFILVTDHQLVNGEMVVYTTSPGVTPINGLVNNFTYFVRYQNTSGFALSLTPSSANVNLFASPLSQSHDLAHYDLNVPFTRFNANTNLTSNFISVPNANNVNRFKTGDLVTYYTNTGNTVITGLSNNGAYYVIAANTSGFKLAETFGGTELILSTNSLSTSSSSGHNLVGRNSIFVRNKPTIRADFANVNFTVGVYDVKKFVYELAYEDATDDITETQYIYQYNPSGNVVAKGIAVTVNQTANAGSITYVPIKGFFSEAEDFHTDGNNALARVTTVTQVDQGGDYSQSPYAHAITQYTNTSMHTVRTSFGSGAQFSVASIGDSEVIYINTDIIGNNNELTLDYDRKILSVGSTTGFDVGDYVYQCNGSMDTVSFDASLVSSTNDFIPIAANPFANGNQVIYSAPGYGRITGPSLYSGGLNPGERYFVVEANSSGLKLAETVGGTAIDIEPKASSETHYLQGTNRSAHGLVWDLDSTNLYIKDVYNGFANTGGIYGNVISLSNSSVNAAITNTDYYTTVLIPPQRPFAALPVTAPAYGFVKNPQGDYADIIFTCLTFERFDIGTIGGLTGIDPGSEYNVDPYVLAYQPYISAFDRRDFIVKIANATDSFIVGEKIQQTPTDLIYYDIEVTGGVRDDVYNEITNTFDPAGDVNDSDNSILVPFITVSVNANTDIDALNLTFNGATDVSSVVDFITIDGHLLQDGDDVLYYTDTGVAAVGGLANNTTYYVLGSNTSGIALSTAPGGAPINITAATVSSQGHHLKKTVDDFITVTGNRFVANTTYNDKVLYYTGTGNTAISGLTNNTLYYVRYSNEFGFSLSTTPTGSNVAITSSSVSESGHYFKSYRNTFVNNDRVIYNAYAGSTAIGGLANNEQYYVVNSDPYSVKLSLTEGGSAINITPAGSFEGGHYLRTVPGYIPGDYVYQEVVKAFNANTGVYTAQDFILISSNPYNVGDQVTYYTAAGNTVITGLANNSSYYVVEANTIGVKISSSLSGSPVDIVASSIVESGHYLKSIPTAKVNSVRVTSGDYFVRVQNTNNTFAPSFPLLSNTNPYLDENVLAVNLFSTTATATGIVKGQEIDPITGTNLLYVKRLTFENTWIVDETIRGDVSGSEATILGVSEDQNTMPIGLNAEISANVATANGVITSLQVVDSGLGYPNSEIIQYSSEDGLRSGSAKAILGGHGISRGYYKSSKGFLSADKYIHDGDFYQEYSYEILSKIGFEKYKDMFKKVLHVAGTRFFGSALVIENAEVPVVVDSIATSQEIMFNAKTDVSTVESSIQLDIESDLRQFNPSLHIEPSNDFITIRRNPFAVNQVVTYTTSVGNTAVTNLANNADYYVVFSNTTGIKISSTEGGAAIQVEQGTYENGHFFTSYINPLPNDTAVQYTVDGYQFNGKSEVDQTNGFVYLRDSTVDDDDVLLYRTTEGTDPLIGLSNNTYYYAVASNTSGTKLANTQGGAPINLVPTTVALNGRTAVNTTNDFISVANNPFANDDVVQFTVAPGGVPIPGLYGDNSYYVVSANSSGVKLSETEGGSPVDIQKTSFAFDSRNNIITKNIIKSFTPPIGYTTFNSQSAVDSVNDFIAISPQPFTTGSYVRYQIPIGGTPVPGLVSGDGYYVVSSNSSGVKLSETFNGAAVNITAAASSQVGHSLALTNNTITFSSMTHSFVNGDIITYYSSTGNTEVLQNNYTYYVTGTTASSIQLAAYNGGPALYIDGTPASEIGHFIKKSQTQEDIIIIQGNTLEVGDQVSYYTGTGARPVGGLSNNGVYWVTSANSVSIKLSTERDGTVVDTTPVELYTKDFDGVNDVVPASNFLAIPSNPWIVGEALVYTTDTRLNPVGGLSNSTVYYVRTANTTGIKLAATPGGTIISLTKAPVLSYTFDASTDANTTSDYIAVSNFDLEDGDVVNYATGTGGTVLGGLANNTNYYVVNANTSVLQLAAIS